MVCRPVNILSVLWVCLVVVAAAAQADEKTSENDGRLRQWHRQFPQADADKDGVLAESEAQAYRAKWLADRGGPPSDAPQPDYANIKYGPHGRNVVDFWKAPSDKPTPVLVYFHGGGFVGGNKSLSSLQKQALQAGISAASANYRFVYTDRFPASLLDGGRVVQFLRSKAQEWNIDPRRIALSGSSAGANMSVWLALHDDLAEEDSPNPVARQSTRVTCTLGSGAQTTNDPRFILEHIGGNPIVYPSVPFAYGIRSYDELGDPQVMALVHECSAINHVSRDDPPIYLDYGPPPPDGLYPPTTPIGESIHSAKFGLLLKEKLDPLGVPCHVYWMGKRRELSQLDFLREQFGLGK